MQLRPPFSLQPERKARLYRIYGPRQAFQGQTVPARPQAATASPLCRNFTLDRPKWTSRRQGIMA